MPEPVRRIAVRTHHFNKAVNEALVRLAEIGRECGLELVAPASEAAKHPDLAALGFAVRTDEDIHDADMCLVFGGDGTVLRALGHNLAAGVPTLGVNFGNVGFLAALPRDGWASSLPGILAGDYRIFELFTVEVHIGERTFTAVNDVVLSRVAPRHVLKLQYEVAGVTVGSMSCDGMIVASPTGSTAYNLSCGGPIVEWDAEVLILNFIAPHSLAFRPVVLRPHHAILARNVSPTQVADVACDGESVGRMALGEAVRIAAGAARARLVMTAESSFYRNVERKLFERPDAC